MWRDQAGSREFAGGSASPKAEVAALSARLAAVREKGFNLG